MEQGGEKIIETYRKKKLETYRNGTSNKNRVLLERALWSNNTPRPRPRTKNKTYRNGASKNNSLLLDSGLWSYTPNLDHVPPLPQVLESRYPGTFTI
jgi:hypothetical protein